MARPSRSFKRRCRRGVRCLGPDHPHTLISLNNLAELYWAQGRFGEAEPLYREALQARREVLGPRHPGALISLSNLAALYRAQGRFGEAEPLNREALQARREVLGPHHPLTLASLNNLAELYQAQGRFGEAATLYREAPEPVREVLGRTIRIRRTSRSTWRRWSRTCPAVSARSSTAPRAA